MSSTKYRMIGTTDDVVDCAACGKPDLASTVVLAFLDDDGNDQGVTYFGTSCAARALTDRGATRTAAQVRREATAAQVAADHESAWKREHATETLNFLGLTADGATDADQTVWAEARRRYFEANPGARTRVSFGDRVASLRADLVPA